MLVYVDKIGNISAQSFLKSCVLFSNFVSTVILLAVLINIIRNKETKKEQQNNT